MRTLLILIGLYAYTINIKNFSNSYARFGTLIHEKQDEQTSNSMR